MKPGYKSTEAHASLLASIFVMMELPPELAAQFVAGIVAVYTVGRSIVKAFEARPK